MWRAQILIGVTTVTCFFYSELVPMASERLGETGLSWVALPKPRTKGPLTVEEALLRRRSVRSFKSDLLMLEEVSQLLWAAQGITSPDGLRTAPSAGALYPMEIYVVAGLVKSLPPGLYRYAPATHQLEKVSGEDKRAELSAAAFNQDYLREAPAIIVIAGILERLTFKYGERSERYLHIEAGHIGQNIFLQATALGIGTVTVGAFNDDGVRSILKIPANEQPLALMPIGKISSKVGQQK